jgi:hypothetical protein
MWQHVRGDGLACLALPVTYAHGLIVAQAVDFLIDNFRVIAEEFEHGAAFNEWATFAFGHDAFSLI